MFEKDKMQIRYIRESYSIEEDLYESYRNMWIAMNKYENIKYSKDDEMVDSEDFKQGFIAGVKIMSSLLLDI